MTGLLSWIILGLIAGALAKFITPGGGGTKDTSGCITTMLIGIIGAAIGGAVSNKVLGWGGIDEFDIKSILLATGGAVILLFIFQLLSKKK